MTKTKRIELSIGSNFVCAFVNADESGLSDEDIKAIDEIIERYGPSFHVYCPEETETTFQRCEVRGLMDDCYNCAVEVSDEK